MDIFIKLNISKPIPKTNAKVLAVHFNSSPPNATYMRQWTGSALFQVMAWHLFGAKPLPEPMPFIVKWTPGNHNSTIFIQENASEIVICQDVGHFVQGEMS